MTGSAAASPSLDPFALVIAARDFEATAAYFRDALGFAIDWAEATDWRLAVRGGTRVMIGRCPSAMTARETGDHGLVGHLQTGDVDALHAEFSRRGAIVLRPPADRPYGQREMVVATPEGHRLVIGQAIGPA